MLISEERERETERDGTLVLIAAVEKQTLQIGPSVVLHGVIWAIGAKIHPYWPLSGPSWGNPGNQGADAPILAPQWSFMG